MADLVYIAGPLFDEGERWWMERVETVVSAAGYRTFLPQRDNPVKTADNVEVIFASNCAQLDTCAFVVANLNGLTTDDGTAWEIGYAYARGRRIVGIHTDWRRRFDDEVVNLMIEQSLTELVHSLDELRELLSEFRP